MERVNDNLKNVKNKIVVFSGKGGVGKSTVSASIATFLAAEGYKVGLLDVDIHGPSIPKLLNIEDKRLTCDDQGRTYPLVSNYVKIISIGSMLRSNDDPIIFRGPKKHAMIKNFLQDVEWGDLDYLIIDSPPGTGDEPLATIECAGPGLKAVVVTTPQNVAIQDVVKGVNFLTELEVPVLGVIENMSSFVCPDCKTVHNIFEKGGGKKLCEDMKLNYLGDIPIDMEIVKSGELNTPFMLKERSETSYKAFKNIINKIIEETK
jgi:Mrp family chromosome partitioning ATPase